MKGEIVSRAASMGFILTADAEEFLEKNASPEELETLFRNGSSGGIITLDTLKHMRKFPERTPTLEISTLTKLEESKKRKELVPPPKITGDVTGESRCTGEIKDFVQYVQDRYNRLSGLLRKKVRSGVVTIPEAKRMLKNAKIIVMVRDVSTTKNGHLILEVEDMQGTIKALINRDSDLISESFMLDEVVCLAGKTNNRGDLFIIDEIIRPEAVRERPFVPSDSKTEVALISDIHVGSNTFLLKEWKRFVNWLGSRDAENVKYIIAAGDVVDGIGIYPGQEEELDISDIYDQYSYLAELFKEIPEHIRIIMQPGNHDAVRPAEPQPTFPKKIRELFPENVTCVGNPAYIHIEGRVILSYHGRSMDDILSSVRGLSYETPIEAMVEMMKRRLLAPTYGQKTPIAPEKKDYLLIDPVPDILLTGHVHSFDVRDFNGTNLINSSTWQSQTEYQKMHNFHPMPARVAVYNVGTGDVKVMNFMEANQ